MTQTEFSQTGFSQINAKQLNLVVSVRILIGKRKGKFFWEIEGVFWEIKAQISGKSEFSRKKTGIRKILEIRWTPRKVSLLKRSSNLKMLRFSYSIRL